MRKVIVPTLNNNDDRCTLVKWLCEDGARVHADQLIAVLETSKATFDLTADGEGYVRRLARAGDECLFGADAALLFDTEAELKAYQAEPAAQPAPPAGGDLIITQDARAAMAQLQISEERVRALGKKVIRRVDVEQLAQAQAPTSPAAQAAAPGEVETPLPRRQIAIARTVSASHAAIPDSFLLIKVYADRLLDWVRDNAARGDGYVGLTELVVKAVALQCRHFPLCFGRTRDEKTLLCPTDPDVGVTFDMGKGLFIPVIRRAASKTLKDIAGELVNFRVKAMRDRFKEEELAPGHITISINIDKDIQLVVPIILPGQICMLSLGATQEELAFNERREVTSRRYFNLGLAYDHRAINGFEAAQFAGKIKAQLESLEALVA